MIPFIFILLISSSLCEWQNIRYLADTKNNNVRYTLYKDSDSEKYKIVVSNVGQENGEATDEKICDKLCKDCTISDIEIGDKISAISNLEEDSTASSGIFANCPGLTSVTFSRSLKNIQRFAFADNEDLRRVTLPDGLEDIGYNAFYNCGLETVTITSTTVRNEAFSSCSNLRSVKFSSRVKYLGLGVFEDCNKIENFEVDGKNEAFTSIDNVLFTKDMTKLIQYPVGRSETTYSVPSSVTSIARKAFSTSSLKTITLTNSITEIGEYAFYNCKELNSIKLPKDLVTIESSTFLGCTKLKSLVLPGSLRFIKSGAFDPSLETITFCGDVAPECNTIFSGLDLNKQEHYDDKTAYVSDTFTKGDFCAISDLLTITDPTVCVFDGANTRTKSIIGVSFVCLIIALFSFLF